ncbi:MAG: peptide deformylase [Myxococcales bacterium]|jgi:peptide deformylase|nr:peptide deformylase [Myxococcales bacterium]
MAIRPILHYPDPRLRIPGERVETFDEELAQLVADMAETMYAAPGVGLAAPQIGVSKRIFVIDIATGEDQPSDLRVFVNPEILELGETCVSTEGCLSFPGSSEEVKRGKTVKVRAQNEKGEFFELEADGLLAIAIQHENDHLDGKLLIDRVSLLRRRILHRQMAKRAAAETTV